MSESSVQERPLAGKMILVVEDDYLIASDVVALLRRLGANVKGPAVSAARAMSAIDRDRPEGIVLDINLNGTDCWVLAEEIVKRGIRLLIVTGYPARAMTEPLRDVPRIEKPFTEARFVAGAKAVFVGGN